MDDCALYVLTVAPLFDVNILVAMFILINSWNSNFAA